MKITDDMIRYISTLVKLELSEKQRLEARLDMESMLVQMEVLDDLDIDDVEPMTHHLALQFRLPCPQIVE